MKSVLHRRDLQRRRFHTRGRGIGDPYLLFNRTDSQPAIPAVAGETAKILAR